MAGKHKNRFQRAVIPFYLPDKSTIFFYFLMGSYTMDQNLTMSRFETYSSRSSTDDLTGTYITSDQPIAVFAGHECASVPYDTGKSITE